LEHQREVCMSVLQQGYRLLVAEIRVEALLHGTSSLFAIET
jgi:hypothetical protein